MGYQQKDATIRFGRELNRLRRLAGYTQARVASAVGCSQTQVGNLERGIRKPDLRMVRDLDEFVGADGRLMTLWTQLTKDGEPAWLDDLAKIEAEALAIMEMHTTVFSAVLQTEEYAHEVARVTASWALKSEIASAVKRRKRRAERFQNSETPTYRAVVDETVLHRRWGADAVMREQLRHVIRLVEDWRITVQVVEATVGHPGLAGPFSLISTPTAPDVVYVESAQAGHVLDEAEVVQRYRVLFSDIQAVALSPTESLQRLHNEMERLSDA